MKQKTKIKVFNKQMKLINLPIFIVQLLEKDAAKKDVSVKKLMETIIINQYKTKQNESE
jgi:hypothetical protein